MLTPDVSVRLQRARALLVDRDADALLLSVGADLPYLTGYEAMPLERLTMLVLTPGAATLVVPRLEAPRVVVADDAFDVVAWDETQDPVAIVADLAAGSQRAFIGDTTWSRFLLGLQDAMPDVAFGPASRLMRELRIRKDPAEIEALRQAAAAADRVMARLDSERFSGRSERDVSRRIGEMLVEEGHDEVAFAIVASGPNGASPHHDAGSRIIETGDAVVVDFGGRLDGYYSDTTRTFAVGGLDERIVQAHAVLEAAQRTGVEAARAGVAAEAVDRATRAVIEEAGWGEYFVHRTGHGIGLDGHEDPYLVEGNDEILEAGMAFSVEPGIYVEGSFGLRIEDIVVIGSDGEPQRLNVSNHGLHGVE